ncbi:glioma pathogenesis-related protein 1-like isoform X1 [Hypanus sabinus]|uniref:glioma pathogenesis-related protein 1-like isoform X1 n=1 Tax=Hypanus sabinus TaxID=79690 RepID=UPI0028C3F47F|nr:glioma pathogenesis-related protein 1-like isoform X1 [Hypanus sabinus]
MDLRGFSKISLNALFYFAAFRVAAAVDIRNKDFIKECISTHNLYRSQVNPPASDMLYMSWDRTLAEAALAWSKKCIFAHNKDLKTHWKLHPVFKTIGENIYVQTGSSLDVPAAIESWHNEIHYYDYNSNRCGKVCGHYTQLVWASSYKVGCAVHTCPGGIAQFSREPSTIFVCDYGPPGNYPRHPYLEGKACTQCPDSWCENRLCRNATREMTNNSDSACDNYCIAVVAMRPLTLIITVVGVYLIQQKYTNMFAYT